ncbi:MAG: NapC/NirT family cytochrome c, partial [Armatimonadota bacterium]|nr:NapC/NirT family cytochrome c [Armatimonadota bacterium]
MTAFRALSRFFGRRVSLPFFRGRAFRLGSLLVFGAVLFTAATAFMMHHSSQPIFCRSCHEMSEHYKTWAVSTHKDVSCESCHIMPGMANMFRTKLTALRMVKKHVQSRGQVDPSGIQGHVPDVNCKQCHPTTREVIVYHSLKITHRKHWERNISCTFCHNRVVHGPNAATKNTPTMQMCYQCHDGKQAPNTCGTCHETLGRRGSATFSPEWVAGHKLEVEKGSEACVRCHRQEFCDTCHRLAKPHPPGFLEVHAAESKKANAACNTCHDQRYCDECHSIR